MTKIILLVFTLISFPVAANIPKEIVEWSKAHVYRVKSIKGSGSGFFISDSKALTACHIVDQSVTVKVYNDKSYFIMVVDKCDRELDLAVLSLKEGEKAEYKAIISQARPPLGRVLYGAGHPLGLPLMIGKGHAQSTYEGSEYFISVPTISGNSGGAILSLIDSAVIVEGVSVGFYADGKKNPMPHLGLAMSGKAINQLLGLD